MDDDIAARAASHLVNILTMDIDKAEMYWRVLAVLLCLLSEFQESRVCPSEN